jgi:hypothetical protein
MGGIAARRHGNDDVLAFFAIGFGYAQQKPVFVQSELGRLADRKQGRMFFIFCPEAENQAVGLKSVFLAQQFLSFLVLTIGAEDVSGDGASAFFL